MLWFDVTKVAGQGHRSGLVRSSERLRLELGRLGGVPVRAVVWHARRSAFLDGATRRSISISPADWLITPELFSEEERPGFTEWLSLAPCRKAAVYHDAIPLRFPEFTWPRSVYRHPHYMKLLSRFDVVLANSRASAAELREYWRWLGIARGEPVAVPFGSDGHGLPRITSTPRHSAPHTVCMLGILEPRKNQSAVLDAAERLWDEGLEFELVVAGRINPHFGRPIARRIRELSRARRRVTYEEALDDTGVVRVFERSRFSLLPSLAEGCGLPALESLWLGVPVVCSDVPALVETAGGGGCRVVRAGDADALCGAMRELLLDDAAVERLQREAVTRDLPTWSETAAAVLAALR